MIERELSRVQGVSLELQELEIVRSEHAVAPSTEELGMRAVELVADDGQAFGREVDADLMLPSGLQIAGDHRVGAILGSGVPEYPKPRRCMESLTGEGDAHPDSKPRGGIELERQLH